MLENAYKITSKSKFSTQNVQIPYHLHPALSYSLYILWVLLAMALCVKAQHAACLCFAAPRCCSLGGLHGV